MNKKRIFGSLLWLASCGWPLCGGAETLYVTDKLFLGLYPNSDGSGQQLEVIPSGTALEVLERDGRYVRVSTPDDEIGWVKANYLVVELPAVVRIEEVKRELQQVRDASDNADSIVTLNRSLEREVEIISKELTSALAEVDDLSTKLADAEQARQQAEADTKAAAQAVSELTVAASTASEQANAKVSHAANESVNGATAEQQATASNPGHAAKRSFDHIGASINRGALLSLGGVLLIAIGFFAGYKFLERHIRRQHGGYRVW